MKFEINQAELLNALTNLTRVTNKSIEVLKKVQIEPLNKTQIRLLCFNGTTSMEYNLSANNVSGEAVMVDVSKFCNIVARLQGMISFNDGVIVAGKNKIVLETMKQTIFEPINIDGEVININSENFKNVIKNRIYACTKVGQGVLSGVCLQNNELCATDGNVLSLGLLEEENKNNSVVLSRSIAEEVTKIFDGDFKMITNNNKIVVFDDKVKLVSNKIAGTFPNYKNLLPKQYENNLKIDKSLIISALDLILTVSDKVTNVCSFTFDKDTLTISGKDATNNGQSVIDIEYKGESMKIGLNALYVLNTLKNLDNDIVNLRFNSPETVLQFDCENEKNLIMPVRLKD